MRPEEARRLKEGDRVYWDDDQSDAGTILRVDRASFTVAWDHGGTQQLRFTLARRIRRLTPALAKAHGDLQAMKQRLED